MESFIEAALILSINRTVTAGKCTSYSPTELNNVTIYIITNDTILLKHIQLKYHIILFCQALVYLSYLTDRISLNYKVSIVSI